MQAQQASEELPGGGSGQVSEDVLMDRVAMLFQEADTDGNGTLSRAEFQQVRAAPVKSLRSRSKIPPSRLPLSLCFRLLPCDTRASSLHDIPVLDIFIHKYLESKQFVGFIHYVWAFCKKRPYLR